MQNLHDSSSIDEAIERLYLLRKIELGLQQIENGEGIEHDVFMKQLEDEEQE